MRTRLPPGLTDFVAGYARNTDTQRWHVVIRTPEGCTLYSRESFATKAQALAAWTEAEGGTLEMMH